MFFACAGVYMLSIAVIHFILPRHRVVSVDRLHLAELGEEPSAD